MKQLPTLFFATAGIFALLGMIWGVQMSASDDHTLAPAHAHLNLIGFVVMSIYGTFIPCPRRLAEAGWPLSTSGSRP